MHPYALSDARDLLSPSLLFYKEIIAQNLRRMIEIAGGTQRLRPHVKTHKTREIVAMELAAGITRHKCATIAEAEMLAQCGAADVLLAYQMVGPNVRRFVELVRKYPQCRFSLMVDHPKPVRELSEALCVAREGQTGMSAPPVAVLVDLDTGQHRTGIAPGDAAVELYRLIDRLPGLTTGGLHVYDGHNKQEEPAERRAAVREQMREVMRLKERLEANGLRVPLMVLGGTPTFPIYAELAREVDGAECSPGTCVLHDHGYGARFPDLPFTPAAVLLTRVVGMPGGPAHGPPPRPSPTRWEGDFPPPRPSPTRWEGDFPPPRPSPTRWEGDSVGRITLDLGYKAVASDPKGDRVLLLDVPEAREVLHNEEHLVVETSDAERFSPGDEVYAIPTHICPTVALHREVYVVQGGRVVGRWQVAARDRRLDV